MAPTNDYGPWAVITGASAGLGEEFARQLAAAKLNLVLVARREDRLRVLQQELARKHGVEVCVIALDLAEEDAPRRLDDATAALDVGLFVNNAGFGYMGRFLQQDEARLCEMVRLNCLAVMRLSHRFGRRLAERGRGGMIVVASLAGFQPTPYMACYGATKGFDLLLGEGLAHELKGSGVDVVVLCPGSTRTEFGAVSGSTGKGGGMRAAPVVASAIRALGRRVVVVPGFANKLAAFLDRLCPRPVVRAACALALKPMVPPEKR
jgi:short-subunit dehydrogenase